MESVALMIAERWRIRDPRHQPAKFNRAFCFLRLILDVQRRRPKTSTNVKVETQGYRLQQVGGGLTGQCSLRFERNQSVRLETRVQSHQRGDFPTRKKPSCPPISEPPNITTRREKRYDCSDKTCPNVHHEWLAFAEAQTRRGRSRGGYCVCNALLLGRAVLHWRGSGLMVQSVPLLAHQHR